MMDTTAKPIVATTSLSFLLHGVVFAGVLLVYNQVATLDEGVGRGVEIQLVSSVLVAEQLETDVPQKQKVVVDTAAESIIHAPQKEFAENILTSLSSTQAVAYAASKEAPFSDDIEDVKQEDLQQEDVQQHIIEQVQLSVQDTESAASVAQSTNASQQQHAILELLHRRISDNKVYPYLARRQRREGVATVSFVLHPDGKIENTHLVTSSRATALDRAALSAVKHIEPFVVAQEYLEHAEEFQVDIEFDLL
jgi:TonB family protein